MLPARPRHFVSTTALAIAFAVGSPRIAHAADPPVEDLGGDAPKQPPKSVFDPDTDDKPKPKVADPEPERPKPTDVPSTADLVEKVDAPSAPDENAGAHGSQGASSEWLPIFIGAGAGLAVGSIVGAAFDNHSPPTVGGLAGAGIGGLAGGASGAWLIRSLRDEDTRPSGALVGASVGAGIATILFTNTDATWGKVTAFALLPAMGAIAGWKIAAVLAGPSTSKKDDGVHKDAPRLMMAPSVAPVLSARSDVTGMTFGVLGAF